MSWQSLWPDIQHDTLGIIIVKASFPFVAFGGIWAVIMNGVRYFEPTILRMCTNRLNNGINYLPIGAVAGGVVLGCFWWAHTIIEGDSSLFVMSGSPSFSLFFGIFCGTFPGAAIGFVYGMFMLPGKGTFPYLIQDISILYKSLWFSLFALALYLNRRILFSSRWNYFILHVWLALWEWDSTYCALDCQNCVAGCYPQGKKHAKICWMFRVNIWLGIVASKTLDKCSKIPILILSGQY